MEAPSLSTIWQHWLSDLQRSTMPVRDTRALDVASAHLDERTSRGTASGVRSDGLLRIGRVDVQHFFAKETLR